MVFFVIFTVSCNNAATETVTATDTTTNHPDTTMVTNTQAPPTATTAIDSLIPEGFEVTYKIGGNLNSDKYPDLLLLLRMKDEPERSETHRPLLILTGNPDGSYRLKARSDSVVYCENCGGMIGDPFMEISVADGAFTVMHYGGSTWRWEIQTTFRYAAADDNWYLEQKHTASMHLTSGEDEEGLTMEEVEEKNTTTKDFGKVPFEKYNEYADN